MTSKTVGSSWPPYFAGQLSPKKPASKRVVCQSAWRAQYSSSVEDVGRPGLFSISHALNRARNSASAGESRKSIDRSQSGALQLTELHAVVAEPLGRQQGTPQVDV